MITKTTLFVFLLSLFGVGLSSCKTYSLSVVSFQNQFTKRTYTIDSIKCTDKKGNFLSLKNSPSLEIHLIYFNDEKSIFDARSVRVNNDTIIAGNTTRDEVGLASTSLFTSYKTTRKEIPLSEIKKICIVKW